MNGKFVHIVITGETVDKLELYLERWRKNVNDRDLDIVFNEIVEAGIFECTCRRIMEEDYAKHDLEGLGVKREVKE